MTNAADANAGLTDSAWLSRPRQFYEKIRRWTKDPPEPPFRSRLFPDLPPFERLPRLPEGYPSITWLPQSYRKAYIARGSNAGFQVPDEILVLYASPHARQHRRPPVIQVHMTRDHDALLYGTHIGRVPHEARRQVLAMSGRETPVLYYNGRYVRSDHGEHVSPKGNRFRWSTESTHAVVFRVDELTVGIRGVRHGGVHEFEFYAMAESMQFPEVGHDR